MLQSHIHATYVGSEDIPYKGETLTKWWFRSHSLRGENFAVRVRAGVPEGSDQPEPGEACLLELQTWANRTRESATLSHVLVSCRVVSHEML